MIRKLDEILTMRNVQRKLWGIYTFLATVLLMMVCAQSLPYFLISIYDLSALYHFLSIFHWLESHRMIMCSFYEVFYFVLVAESSALSELILYRR